MKICIPVKEKNLQNIQEAISGIFLAKFAKIRRKYEVFVEIWLDCLSLASAAKLIKNSRLPVVVVCKGKKEKGDFRGSEKQRIARITAAVYAGAKYVDVGADTAPALVSGLKKICEKRRCKLIVSQHFWKKTPGIEKLEAACLKAKRLGADIIKIAARINRWSDNAVLFELASRMKDAKQKFIIAGMGSRSELSRLGCWILGGYWTYAALDEKQRTAEGQMLASSL